MEILNLPTAEQKERELRLLEKMAYPDAKPTDYSGSPGNNFLIAGTKEKGFYGFVQPEEMGLILGNPDDKRQLTASNLALAIGLTQGTAINEKTPWMKFSRKGKVLFVPVKPLRHTVSWDSIYKAGAVYGSDTIGVLPNKGRIGKRLSADAATNSFTFNPATEGEGFLYSSGRVGNVGDQIVTRGWPTAGNNGTFTITAITDTSITVTGGTLTTETGDVDSSLYRKGDEVTQNAKKTIGDHQFRVRLLKGASQDPLDSYVDADRDLVGPENEWNSLILPLHEQAKLQNWAYAAYAGTTEDWGIGLSDADLSTHYNLGLGSYNWCQETSDEVSHARVNRGYNGASYGTHYYSWVAYSFYGWRPCLELI